MRRSIASALALSVGVLIAAGSAESLSRSALRTYTVHMSGRQAYKGSPVGTGTFRYQLVSKNNLLCYALGWSRIDTPTDAHVNRGVNFTLGPIVILLSKRAPVAHSGCVKVTVSRLRAIKSKPRSYYVEVDTKKYPHGAIRGQLG